MQQKIYRKGKYDEKRTGGRGCTSGFSREKIANGGKTITIGQLIELQIIMTISRQ